MGHLLQKINEHMHFLWINALIIKLKLKIEKKPESRRDDKIELKIIKDDRSMNFFQAITEAEMFLLNCNSLPGSEGEPAAADAVPGMHERQLRQAEGLDRQDHQGRVDAR